MERTLKKQNHAEDNFAPQRMYTDQLITISDLAQFKKQLTDEFALMLKTQTSPPVKRWMKSHEVRRLLKISPGTLQTLKSSGILPYTKMGGVHFFDYQDIENILQSGKINPKIK